MYLRLSRLRRFVAISPAGTLGSVASLYFDPDDWAVRFFSVENRSDRYGSVTTLISPLSVTGCRPGDHVLDVDLRSDPSGIAWRDRERPIPSRVTGRLVHHYQLPVFWQGTGVWGDYSSPRTLRALGTEHADRRNTSAPTLFSNARLIGREVHSSSGELGVISDLLVDLVAWRIRYFIIWLGAPGETGEILLSPFWVNGLPVRDRATVPMTTGTIVSGPTFIPEDLEPLDEQILARYFGFLTE